MRKIVYEELAGLSNDAIAEITSSREDFVVLASEKNGKHLQHFVKNDETFRSGGKTIFDRITYVCSGWHGFFLPSFLQIWNRACIDGYTVKRIDVHGKAYEVWFSHD